MTNYEDEDLGFSTLFKMSGLQAALKKKGLVDVKVAHTAQERLTLERRIQDIIEGIEAVEEEFPEEDMDSDMEPGEQRQVCSDFLEIPYEALPEYDSMVRVPMSLAEIRNKLQGHSYHSLSMFARDFYLMLNNGRQVTPKGSQTWMDTETLAASMEELKEWSYSDESRAQRDDSDGLFRALEAVKVTGKQGKPIKGSVEHTCLQCNSAFRVMKWPEGTDKAAKKGGGKKDKKDKKDKKKGSKKGKWRRGRPRVVLQQMCDGGRRGDCWARRARVVARRRGLLRRNHRRIRGGGVRATASATPMAIGNLLTSHLNRLYSAKSRSVREMERGDGDKY